jgi:LysM repeat protein
LESDTDSPDAGDGEALPDDWTWHVVRPGESLSQIAARHGVDRRALETANDLRGGAALQIGKKLKIPPPEKSSDTAAEAGDRARPRSGASPDHVLGYFVLKGDTVASVAGQFGTDAETIRQLNGLGRSETLAPGRRIVVPNNGIIE